MLCWILPAGWALWKSDSFKVQYQEYVGPSGRCLSVFAFDILNQITQHYNTRIDLQQRRCWHSRDLISFSPTSTVAEPSRSSEVASLFQTGNIFCILRARINQIYMLKFLHTDSVTRRISLPTWRYVKVKIGNI